MIWYELRIKYQRQTEQGVRTVTETYLANCVSCAEAENRLLENVRTFFFDGDYEVSSCKKTQLREVLKNSDGAWWYKARVEMITIDEDKEIRKKVAFLIQANAIDDAIFALKQEVKNEDCEIISIAKSPIMDVLDEIK